MTGYSQPHRRNLFRSASLVLATLCTVLVVATAAHAADTPKERKCRSLIAKNVRKVAGLVLRARTECISGKLRGVVGDSVNCMADPSLFDGPGTGDPDTDAKLSLVSDVVNRQVAAVAEKCATFTLPSIMGLDTLCNPPEPNDWSAVARCASVDIGKKAGDTLSRLLEVPATRNSASRRRAARVLLPYRTRDQGRGEEAQPLPR